MNQYLSLDESKKHNYATLEHIYDLVKPLVEKIRGNNSKNGSQRKWKNAARQKVAFRNQKFCSNTNLSFQFKSRLKKIPFKFTSFFASSLSNLTSV